MGGRTLVLVLILGVTHANSNRTLSEDLSPKAFNTSVNVEARVVINTAVRPSSDPNDRFTFEDETENRPEDHPLKFEGQFDDSDDRPDPYPSNAFKFDDQIDDIPNAYYEDSYSDEHPNLHPSNTFEFESQNDGILNPFFEDPFRDERPNVYPSNPFKFDDQIEKIPNAYPENAIKVERPNVYPSNSLKFDDQIKEIQNFYSENSIRDAQSHSFPLKFDDQTDDNLPNAYSEISIRDESPNVYSSNAIKFEGQNVYSVNANKDKRPNLNTDNSLKFDDQNAYSDNYVKDERPNLYPENIKAPDIINNTQVQHGVVIQDNNRIQNQIKHPGQKKRKKRRRRRPKFQRLPQGYPGQSYPRPGGLGVPQTGVHSAYLNQVRPYQPHPRPTSTPDALSAVTDALTSIAQHDDKQCVAKLLCEAASGRAQGSGASTGLLQSIVGIQPLLTLLSAYGGVSTSPLFVFGRSVFLGMTSRGNAAACNDAYPLCPTDTEQLVHYLNNHNGGFFRFFGAPQLANPQYGLQNLEQFYNQLSVAGQYGLQQQNTPGQFGLQQPHAPGQYGLQQPYAPGQYGLQQPNIPGQFGFQQINTPGQFGFQQLNTPGQFGLQQPNTPGQFGLLQQYTGQQQPNLGPLAGQQDYGNFNNYDLHKPVPYQQGYYGFSNPHVQNHYGAQQNRYKNNKKEIQDIQSNQIQRRIQNNSPNSFIGNSYDKGKINNSKWLFPQYANYGEEVKLSNDREGKRFKFSEDFKTQDKEQEDLNKKAEGFIFPGIRTSRQYIDYKFTITSTPNPNLKENANNKHVDDEEEGIRTIYVVRGNGDPNHPEIVKIKIGQT